MKALTLTSFAAFCLVTSVYASDLGNLDETKPTAVQTISSNNNSNLLPRGETTDKFDFLLTMYADHQDKLIALGEDLQTDVAIIEAVVGNAQISSQFNDQFNSPCYLKPAVWGLLKQMLKGASEGDIKAKLGKYPDVAGAVQSFQKEAIQLQKGSPLEQYIYRMKSQPTLSVDEDLFLCALQIHNICAKSTQSRLQRNP